MFRNKPNNAYILFKFAFSAIAVTSFVMLLYSCQSISPKALGQTEGNIAFVSNRLDQYSWLWILILDSENHTVEQALGTKHSILDPPSWSPDGQALAFVALPFYGASKETDNEYPTGTGITLVDKEGNETAFGPCRVSPAWSPDGQYLAFHEYCDGSPSLNVAHVDGSNERELATDLVPRDRKDGSMEIIRISWSPDGQYIAYDNESAGIWHIWVVPSKGGPPQQLTVGRHPTWSPFGEEIAFDREGDIWIIQTKTGFEQKLAGISVYSEWPTWSPDGQKLAFEGGQGANTEIFLVNRDGSNLQMLTRNSVPDLFPAWRPELIESE